MKLTIVGCAGSYPNAAGPASSYLVEHDGYRIVMDMGNGALGPLHTHVDPLAVDAVLLSHLHADHFLDMCSYYVLRRYHPAGIPPRIPVYGPPDTHERMTSAYGMALNPGMVDVFDVRTYPESGFALGPFTVQVARVYHPVTTYALRLSAGGKTLVFSGDSAPCDALTEIAQDADLALFEASYREGDDNPVGLHMTPRESAGIAAAAGVRRLVLTHMVTWHDNSAALAQARSEFGAAVDLATPGMVLEV